jgi:hypothetical protein
MAPLTIQGVPKRSTNMPKASAQNVFCIGMVTVECQVGVECGHGDSSRLGCTVHYLYLMVTFSRWLWRVPGL